MSSKPSFSEAAERHTTSRTSDGSVLHALLRTAEAAGIDAAAELYNEALQAAKDGHYGEARNRLNVLLGLNPSDGDAHMLLAKVYVGGQQWRRALASLDEASQYGVRSDDGLRERVLRNLQAEGYENEDETARSLREQGEVKKLRAEARRARSDNAHLAATNRNLQKEVAFWTWAASGVALLTILLLTLTMLFWPSGAQVAEASAVAAVAPSPVAPAVGGAAAQPVVPAAAVAPEVAGVGQVDAGGELTVDLPSARNAELADAVKSELAAAGFADIGVVVRGSKLSLSGKVPTHAAHKALIAAAEALPDITAVSAEGVENVARKRGTTHVVQPGESLSVIAWRMYGDQSLANRIIDANPKLGGKPNLQVNMELVIPAIK